MNQERRKALEEIEADLLRLIEIARRAGLPTASLKAALAEARKRQAEEA